MIQATSYAVSWRDGAAQFVGYAELAGDALRLEGRGANGREGLRTIRCADIGGVELRRTNGARSISLELTGTEPILIFSLDRPGSLGELADRIRRLTDSPHG